MQTAKVRPAAVAGMFYPGSRHGLQAKLAELTSHAPKFEGTGVKAIIAPHAGYVYSGRVAASAFAALWKSAPAVTRAVVIGPALAPPCSRTAR